MNKLKVIDKVPMPDGADHKVLAEEYGIYIQIGTAEYRISATPHNGDKALHIMLVTSDGRLCGIQVIPECQNGITVKPEEL